MFEFDCILLKPCLLHPCFHVAGTLHLPRATRPQQSTPHPGRYACGSTVEARVKLKCTAATVVEY